MLDSCILLCGWSKLLSDHAGCEDTLFSSVSAVPVLCECSRQHKLDFHSTSREKNKKERKGENRTRKEKGGGERGKKVTKEEVRKEEKRKEKKTEEKGRKKTKKSWKERKKEKESMHICNESFLNVHLEG